MLSNQSSSRTARPVWRNEQVVVIGLPPKMRQRMPQDLVGKVCTCARPIARIGRVHRACSVDLIVVRAASARINATRQLKVVRVCILTHKHALPNTRSLNRLRRLIGRRLHMATVQSTAKWSSTCANFGL